MKTESEVRNYEFDFGNQPEIKAGRTIVDVLSLTVLTATSPPLVQGPDSPSIVSPIVSAPFSGGIKGFLYRVDIKVKLDDDRILEDQATIRVYSEEPPAISDPFSAEDLLYAAKQRFGEEILRARVAPQGSEGDKETELLKIARSVVARVQGAAEQADSWPLPGRWPVDSVSPIDGTTDISDVPFQYVWPDDLMQRALDLFDWRTYQGLEVIPQSKVSAGKEAEKYFFNVSRGIEALAVGGPGEPSSGRPLVSRDRQGRTLIADGSYDRLNVLDSFRFHGWDWS
jgi:hypothetical protein